MSLYDKCIFKFTFNETCFTHLRLGTNGIKPWITAIRCLIEMSNYGQSRQSYETIGTHTQSQLSNSYPSKFFNTILIFGACNTIVHPLFIFTDQSDVLSCWYTLLSYNIDFQNYLNYIFIIPMQIPSLLVWYIYICGLCV